MRILIISFFFPPYNLVGCVRTGKMAKYLIRFGHDVRVISAREQNLHSATLALEIPPEYVTYTAWLNPRWPVDKVYGHGKVVPWSDRATAAQPSGGHRALRSLLRFTRSVLYFPDMNIGWLPFAFTAGARLMADWKPDVIYASASPNTSLIIAHLLARRYGLPWVGDLRDLWVDNHNYEFAGWRMGLEQRLEYIVMSTASGLVTVSEPLADTLKRRFGKPTEVILNGFDAEDYPILTGVPGRNDTLRIVFTGTIYVGSQSPAPLFKALQLMGKKAEKVRVVFYGASRKLVQELASSFGVVHLIGNNEPVPHRDALIAQSEADILLHLLWNDPTQPGVYGAKVFEYLGARRPILAVGYIGNVAAQLIQEREAGVVLDDPVAIASQLEQWIGQKELTGKIPSLDSLITTGLSREEQARQLEIFLRQCLNKKVE